MVLPSHVVEQLKKQCPELKQLPEDWTFNVNTDKSVSFVKTTTRETTWHHPNLGPLPKPWILKVEDDGTGKVRPIYYNSETRKQSKDDPRHFDSTLRKHSKNAPRGLWIAASMVRNSSKINPENFKRTPINNVKSIRDEYTVIHTIDDGKGKIGGMNGGVFVVAMKGVASRIYIEKRFISEREMVRFARREIEMMYRVNHPALTSYSATFILENANPPQASLYMEFCDRGSLADLIKTYATRRINGDRNAKVPEGFVWHALCGLVDALAYLQSGGSMIHKKDVKPDPSWVPILHRDIKPDNIFIRSRATLGTTKYFYVILSDFGLACEDRDVRDSRLDKYQNSGLKLGTPTWIAPELCYDPYPSEYPGPSGVDELSYYPPGRRHTKYSDLWAVGASIYNLCEFNDSASGLSHLDISRMNRIPGMTSNRYVEGTESRRRDLTIPSHYSFELRKAVSLATKWGHRERPSPVTWSKNVEPLLKSSGFAEHGENCEPLPEWATKVHEYMSKAEKINSRGRDGFGVSR